MMKKAADQLRTAIQQIPLGEPHIPYISNVTGQFIEQEQAQNPNYWAEHLLSPVAFSHGVAQLKAIEEVVFIEVGAHQVLSSLSNQQLDKTQASISCQRDPKANTSGVEDFYKAMAKLWQRGFTVDWHLDQPEHRSGTIQRCHLPGYAFQTQSYWVARNNTHVFDHYADDPSNLKDSNLEVSALSILPKQKDWFY